MQMIKDSFLTVNSLMWQVIKQLTKIKKQDLDKFGLTCSQFEILSAIYHFSVNDEEIIQIDLSERTQIDPMTTSTILRNLQRKGFITRTRSPVNTRTIIVRITPLGEELYRKALSKVGKTSKLIYQNIDKKLLVSQLIILSDKLNKLNF
ncbi:DNA-binding transcriptional regulator, MarR family [Dysgonomonas macrotermitis]|uniref:DNA-binding transcriptional regulator, MarR family n=2 Tax=Dysgonomonas macrotermitis TaxID=1346286 RepID=A0A1M5BPL9_9BACT|nr:DNA-binding transcriptional regulator, MarR family [Dysgonomonas macrotermitis]